MRPGSKRGQDVSAFDGMLSIAVPARAVDGKANEAVVAAIAKLAGVGRKDVEMLSGHRSRRKRIRIYGNPTTWNEVLVGLGLSGPN